MSNPYTIFKVYSALNCHSDLFKDIYRWYPYKHFSSKQAALNSIKRFREKNSADLVFKIVKGNIYTNSHDKVVYDESERG